MLIEWELTSYCNYNCKYCKLPNIKEENNWLKIDNFITNTLKNYRNIELFCFGGEPFLNKNINRIISKLIEVKQLFIIQTNASQLSINNMNKISNNITIQISIHPSQLKKEELKNIKNINKNININKIDVMYSSKEAIKYYIYLKKLFPKLNIYLIPISGFYENESCKYTYEYNKLRSSVYSKIIQFEDCKIGNKYRSDIWEDFCRGNLTTYGKECLYKNNYILFDSMLNRYNCCYRKNNEGICQEQKCFLM